GVFKAAIADFGTIIPPTISTGTVSTSFCEGSDVSVPFTITGTFNPGNVFTAQLSDRFGDFTIPVVLGTLTGTGAGTINGTIPLNTPAGADYRIRVVASAPITTGTNNGSDISLYSLPTAEINGAQTAVQGTSENYNVNGTQTSKFKWIAQGGQITSVDTSSEITILWGNGTSGKVKLTETSPDNCIDSTEINVLLIVSDVEEPNSINDKMLKIYPNPVYDFIELKCNKGLQATVRNIEIFSVLGIKVIDTEYRDRINVSFLSPGVYFLKTGNKFSKFMKI
ncbi:MAG: T9SS type A sorting domain-containing protein, partial [Bacteroidota bacterium]